MNLMALVVTSTFLVLALPGAARAEFSCPSEDNVGNKLANSVTSTDSLVCTYLHGGICEYDLTSGSVEDADNGNCPDKPLGSAAPTSTETPTVTPTPLVLGDSCVGSDRCQSGFCANGVCCDAACDRPSQDCNLPERAGHCDPILPSPPMSKTGLIVAVLLLAVIGVSSLWLRRDRSSSRVKLE